ncbi:MAG: HEAT repeat domain-containing protein [Elusimicrobiota bacterium]|jgi:HEAT repeat protein
MRWLLAAVLAGALAYFLLERKEDADYHPPPEPPQVTLPMTPVLSLEEIAKVRQSTRDQDPDVRWAAIKLLVTLKDPEIVSVMDKVIAQEPDPGLRARSIELLRSADNVGVLPPIIRGLKDPDKDVRISCLKTLGDIGDPAAIPWVVEALHDVDPEVKVAALRAMGRFQEQRAQEFEQVARQLRQNYESAVQRSQSLPPATRMPGLPAYGK